MVGTPAYTTVSGSVQINTFLRDNITGGSNISVRGPIREKSAETVAAAAEEAAKEAARERTQALREEVRREFDGMLRACRRLRRGSSSASSVSGGGGGGGGGGPNGSGGGGGGGGGEGAAEDAHWRTLVREYAVLCARGDERCPRALAIAKFVATVAARGEAVASFAPGAEGFVNGYILGPGYNDDGGDLDDADDKRAAAAGGGSGGGAGAAPVTEPEIGGEWRVSVRRNQVDVIFNSFNPGSDAERRRWRHVRRARVAAKARKARARQKQRAFESGGGVDAVEACMAREHDGRKGSVLVDAEKKNMALVVGLSQDDDAELTLDAILQMHAESDDEWEQQVEHPPAPPKGITRRQFQSP